MKDIFRNFFLTMGLMYTYITIISLFYTVMRKPIVIRYITDDKKVISVPVFEGTNDASDN